MADPVLRRIPVVGGLGFVERIRQLPSSFVVTLVPEPDNRYLPQAIAVIAEQGKVGYVAPEIARGYYDALRGAGTPVTCAARRSALSDHETSGVELLLDFSDLPLSPSV